MRKGRGCAGRQREKLTGSLYPTETPKSKEALKKEIVQLRKARNAAEFEIQDSFSRVLRIS